MSSYNTEKKKHKVKSHSVGMILPLYIFTILFVACPLIYMVALSFATPGAVHGVEWKFTFDNYKKILEPVYLNTFVQSFKLAVTSTLIIGLVGYPFGYFMAKLPAGKKKKAMLFLMLPFWVNSLIRLYGWIIILQKKGILNFVLKKLGIIDKPLKLLYSYPAIVVGMVYVLLPFMILSVYSSAEKMDWSLVEAARDLGASSMRAFWDITLPLIMPAVVSGSLLAFAMSMDDVVISIFINGPKLSTLPIKVYTQIKTGVTPEVNALCTIMLAFTVAVLLLYSLVRSFRRKRNR